MDASQAENTTEHMETNSSEMAEVSPYYKLYTDLETTFVSTANPRQRCLVTLGSVR